MSSKFNFKTILGIIVGITIAALIQQVIIPKYFVPSFDEQLMKLSNEMNKNCPFMVDAETRLDNTMAGVGKSIVYNYTLVNFLKEDIDMSIFEDIMKPQILNNIKTNPEMEDLRKNNVTFSYNYKDKSAVHIITIKYGPNDYN